MRLNEKMLAKFFDLSRDLLCVATPAGFFKDVNQAFEDTLGFSKNELVSRPFIELVHPDDVEPTVNELQKLSEGTPTVHFENRYRTSSGTYRWLAWTSSPADDGLIYAVAHDVTGEKEREQELKNLLQARYVAEKSEKETYDQFKAADTQFGIVLDAATEGFLLTNADHQIIWANQALRRMFSFKSTDLIGRKTIDLKPVLEKVLQDPETFFKRADEIYADRRAVIEEESVEVSLPRALSLSRSSAPIWSQTDEYLGRLWVYRDVSKTRALDKAKSEFISVVSHELRTPLTSVQGAIGLLNSGELGEFDEKAATLIQIADQNARQLVRLINDILDLERIESGRSELTLSDDNAHEIVAEAISHVQATAESQTVTIENSVSHSDIPVDRDRLVHVFVNLIDNAIKFSSPGASVRITSSFSDGQIEFTVADSGPGIPTERLESVFTRFEQIDSSDTRNKGGTGLGLAICKSIIEQHNGRIWAESTPGQGSQLRISLPIDSEQDAPAPATGDDFQVLIVEDDLSLARVISEALSQRGISSAVAVDAAEGILSYANHSYQTLIVDINLPGMNGLEMLAEIKRVCQRNNSRVIVYSAREPQLNEIAKLGGILEASILKSEIPVEGLIDIVDKLVTDIESKAGAA